MPSLIVAASVVLAVALIETDSAGGDRWLAKWPRLFGAGPEGAHQLLSTLAGSMMTVMGITFSMRTARAAGGRCANKCSGLPSWPIAPSTPRMIARESRSG